MSSISLLPYFFKSTRLVYWTDGYANTFEVMRKSVHLHIHWWIFFISFPCRWVTSISHLFWILSDLLNVSIRLLILFLFIIHSSLVHLLISIFFCFKNLFGNYIWKIRRFYFNHSPLLRYLSYFLYKIVFMCPLCLKMFQISNANQIFFGGPTTLVDINIFYYKLLIYDILTPDAFPFFLNTYISFFFFSRIVVFLSCINHLIYIKRINTQFLMLYWYHGIEPSIQRNIIFTKEFFKDCYIVTKHNLKIHSVWIYRKRVYQYFIKLIRNIQMIFFFL